MEVVVEATVVGEVVETIAIIIEVVEIIAIIYLDIATMLLQHPTEVEEAPAVEADSAAAVVVVVVGPRVEVEEVVEGLKRGEVMNIVVGRMSNLMHIVNMMIAMVEG